jgi:hypothetical protein
LSSLVCPVRSELRTGECGWILTRGLEAEWWPERFRVTDS